MTEDGYIFCRISDYVREGISLGVFMITFTVTCLMFLAFYYLFPPWENPLRKILISFVMTCSQIVIVELVLGLFGNLSVPYLLLNNLLIVLVLMVFGSQINDVSLLSVLKRDGDLIRHSFADALDVHTITLGVILLLTYAWILVAAFFLPPRGVDDLTYHLPAIFEYVQSHEIRLLPVALRTHFAFPENAELLFIWPLVFAKNIRMVSGLNVLFVFMSVLTLLGLLRHFEISRRDAAFASMLYAFCPVVLMQAGVNYIDIIVSLFLLLALYFACLFYASRKMSYLFVSGLTVGLLLGMKYTALLLVLPLQVLIVPHLFRLKARHAAVYGLSVVTLSGWWYLRNYVVLNDPFYPLNLLGPLFGERSSVNLMDNITVNLRQWTSRILMDDAGVGSYDGGFGLVFWGVGVSSWLYMVAYSLLHPVKIGFSRFVVLAYLPVGFLLLLTVSAEDARYTGRFSLFIVAVGLFAFCETMKILNEKGYSSILKFTCTGLSIVTLSLMFVSDQPSYRLGTLINDKINNRNPSAYNYLSDSLYTQAALRYVWEPLDYLTRDDRVGLNCYLVSDFKLFAPAPVYGTNLQNHICYTDLQARGRIDAVVFTYYPGNKGSTENHIWRRLIPLGGDLHKPTNGHDLLVNNDYRVIGHSDNGCLVMHKSIYDDPNKQRLLQAYYQSSWPEAVAVATQLAPELRESIPIVTSSQVGYGMRCLDMRARRTERVLMLPKNMEEEIATCKHIKRCYTLQRPLAGFTSRRIYRTLYQHRDFDVYLNTKG